MDRTRAIEILKNELHVIGSGNIIYTHRSASFLCYIDLDFISTRCGKKYYRVVVTTDPYLTSDKDIVFSYVDEDFTKFFDELHSIFKEDGSIRYSKVEDHCFTTDEEQIKKETLTEVKYFLTKTDIPKCCVCMEPNTVRIDGCFHNLCRLCFNEMCKTTSAVSCPLCRETIKVED
jgi:hypothetical protein